MRIFSARNNAYNKSMAYENKRSMTKVHLSENWQTIHLKRHPGKLANNIQGLFSLIDFSLNLVSELEGQNEGTWRNTLTNRVFSITQV